MDIIKTGEFIAKLRKDKGLTQEQFGDKMGVTNKTVSRWETGKYLPPADILLLMSELFDVSINELLAGQRLSDDEYKQTADNNLTEALRSSRFTTKDKIDFFKKMVERSYFYHDRYRNMHFRSIGCRYYSSKSNSLLVFCYPIAFGTNLEK